MNKRSGEASKQKILDAAQAVFADQGYARASMRAIAQAAGISVGGLYLYFKNKEELYLTLVQSWMDSLNASTGEALQRIQDPRESLRVFITISIDYAKRHKGMIVLQGREMGVPFGIEAKRRFFRERRRLIAGIVTRGIDSGVFRHCDADEAAKVIFSVLRGFIVSMVIEDDALFSPEVCVDMLLNGLVRRDSE
ncbi:MAG TPA: TetR/AcrR family transcriptional regulator [Geobacteraceae bacterium]